MRELILTDSFNRCPLTEGAGSIKRLIADIKKIDTNDIHELDSLSPINKNSFWKKLNQDEAKEMKMILSRLKTIQEDLEYNAIYNDRGAA